MTIQKQLYGYGELNVQYTVICGQWATHRTLCSPWNGSRNKL